MYTAVSALERTAGLHNIDIPEGLAVIRVAFQSVHVLLKRPCAGRSGQGEG